MANIVILPVSFYIIDKVVNSENNVKNKLAWIS